ncbi:hypothetical protein FRC16_005489 [Serendipita sp. 398]|nr:hypothetical protein FRC16_005489 [Serendipita sp. 398]
MALVLNIWTSLLLGILYMFFSAFPIVFTAHGFNLEQKGLTFIGIGVGIIIATAVNPLFSHQVARRAERRNAELPPAERTPPPPEDHLLKGLYGAVICPLALFWFAFTTYPSVHWVVPIIASVPFGFGMVLAYSSTFTFLVDAYRPYAASALAANSFMRSALAGAFPLFTVQSTSLPPPTPLSVPIVIVCLLIIPTLQCIIVSAHNGPLRYARSSYWRLLHSRTYSNGNLLPRIPFPSLLFPGCRLLFPPAH